MQELLTFSEIISIYYNAKSTNAKLPIFETVILGKDIKHPRYIQVEFIKEHWSEDMLHRDRPSIIGHYKEYDYNHKLIKDRGIESWDVKDIVSKTNFYLFK